MERLGEVVAAHLENSTLSEEEAINLFHYLREQFGWAGMFFTRADVESRLDRDITDHEWKEVKSTRTWREMGSIWTEAGAWEDVDEAINSAGI